MSSHLIQPIELFDWDEVSLGLQCIKHGNTTPKWRTVSTLLGPGDYISLVGSEDDDKWQHVLVSIEGDASVKFATSCLKRATLRFHIPEITEFDNADEATFYLVTLDINGVEIENDFVLADGVAIGDPAQTVDYIVDLEALGLECRPCGNTWKIRFGYSTIQPSDVLSMSGLMTLEIVDVTF